jgi:hypothetical protein
MTDDLFHVAPYQPLTMWICPVCLHIMSEEQSKGYRGCPSGIHFVQHVQVIVTPAPPSNPENAADCEFCGDNSQPVHLHARCHLTAPLRAELADGVLTLYCYIPECNRVVVRVAVSNISLAHPPNDARHDKETAAPKGEGCAGDQSTTTSV